MCVDAVDATCCPSSAVVLVLVSMSSLVALVIVVLLLVIVLVVPFSWSSTSSWTWPVDCCSDCGSDGLDSCCCWSPFCAFSSLAGPLLSFFPFASRTDSCQSRPSMYVYSVVLSTRHMITSAYIGVRSAHARIILLWIHAYGVLRTPHRNSWKFRRKEKKSNTYHGNPDISTCAGSRLLQKAEFCSPLWWAFSGHVLVRWAGSVSPRNRGWERYICGGWMGGSCCLCLLSRCLQ